MSSHELSWTRSTVTYQRKPDEESTTNDYLPRARSREVVSDPAAAQRSTLHQRLSILSSSDRGEVESRVRSEAGMNKTYRVVLSDDEQKMLAVVLKKEKMRDLQGLIGRLLRQNFFAC